MKKLLLILFLLPLVAFAHLRIYFLGFPLLEIQQIFVALLQRQKKKICLPLDSLENREEN